MPTDDKIVAVGLFTAQEFKRWGSKLRHVYTIEDDVQFDDLLTAIDKAEASAALNKRTLEQSS